jgi:hypothetical protein
VDESKDQEFPFAVSWLLSVWSLIRYSALSLFCFSLRAVLRMYNEYVKINNYKHLVSISGSCFPIVVSW